MSGCPIHEQSTIEGLARRRPFVLMELDNELRSRLVMLLADMGGRVAPWEGYRGPEAQAAAKASGNSNAAFGESPHNFKPALAVDVVLHPSFVSVRANKTGATYPDLWDDESPEAVKAWADLDAAAARVGLERVDLAPGKRDRPHLQLPGWQARLKVRAV